MDINGNLSWVCWNPGEVFMLYEFNNKEKISLFICSFFWYLKI